MPDRELLDAPHEDPTLVFKLTRGTSCVLCQQRKVRCDKSKPCANCVKAGIECKVIPPAPPRRRKKRPQEKDLIDRIRMYESILSDNGIPFESMAPDVLKATENTANSQPGDDVVGDLENDFEGLKTSASTGPSASPEVMEQDSGVRKFLASEELFRDSSDDEDCEGSRVHRTFDHMYESQDSFPFMVGGHEIPVTHLHPEPFHIFQLWQTYITNVNPLLRISHAPTTQQRIIEASTQLNTVSRETEVLMFAMYLVSVNSMDDDACLKIFNQPRRPLLIKFHGACQQALINAGFMRTSDITVLQAFTLYLISVRQFMDPRQIYCLTGMAIRIGHRLGLHRDPAAFGLPPFEVEIRRRLWFALTVYDRRLAEMVGSTVSAMAIAGDCRPPLNINDSDLHVDGKVAPTPHAGPSEMIFALSRYEFGLATTNAYPREPEIKESIGIKTEFRRPQQQQQVMPTVTLPFHGGLTWTLDGFAQHIEQTYIRHCDPKIPLHFFTTTMARQALCKMRVVSFLVRMSNTPYNGPGDSSSSSSSSSQSPLNAAERETLFVESIQMIEYDNVIHAAESLKCYKWFTYIHFPIPAYMFLVSELRRRTSGAMVERAWDAITKNQQHRGSMNMLHSPMHNAFGNLFCKAWDAYEAAQRARGVKLTAPAWVTRLRVYVEKRKQAKAAGLTPVSVTMSPGAVVMGAAVFDIPIKRDVPDQMHMGAGGASGTVMSPSGNTTGAEWGMMMQEYPSGMAGYAGYTGRPGMGRPAGMPERYGSQ
ncbi:hypothetical protein TD95_002407 [Thielaviopsis punctulata]|uniref:Zn(2)-C6 fungal-type domain-containing protein n=1 Tax=Thielaviopsis punctulata TaxID=72032 RepID=A0A0F4ZCE3_9PEZI|nr:hypothetical protein TD95_002407 [Thielaviopsis punctulata]